MKRRQKLLQEECEKCQTQTEVSITEKPKLEVEETVNKSIQCKNKYERRPSSCIRYDGFGHEMKKDKNRQRCKYDSCNMKTYTTCVKCNVHLCFGKRDCFHSFHVK